jgi:hypothetical protein
LSGIICMPIDRLGLFRMVKISHSNKRPQKQNRTHGEYHGLWSVLSKFDLKCVYSA